jgi:hypothetical protein
MHGVAVGSQDFTYGDPSGIGAGVVCEKEGRRTNHGDFKHSIDDRLLRRVRCAMNALTRHES